MAETVLVPRRIRLALALLVAFGAAPLGATPLAREDVPQPLRPWIDWVLRGHEAETCPLLLAQGERQCVWPGRLELALDASGGRFAQQLFVAAESDVLLPGAAESWPEDVRLNGAGAPIFERAGRPALRLPRGTHEISGRFVWGALPPVLLVPAETGVVALRVNGEPVAFPRRDAEGRLWLRDAEEPAPREAEDHVEIEVHRRIADEIPLVLETRVTLRVSGASRDEQLGRALPDGFVPTGLSGPLPARLDPDGRLRVQVRPGNWVFTLTARHPDPVAQLALPAQPEGARWDLSEVWSFEARPALRLVEVEGAPAVDPTQTELPPDWRELPAYRVEPGGGLRLVEKRRGGEGGAADQLALSRTWHLDFDGNGATVIDRIEGELRSATRLEMGQATSLGRAAVNGVDQPVTTRAGMTQRGVELPLGSLSLEADSRVEADPGWLPAVGWDADVDALSATLELPPGWRLLHVSGVDSAHPTWIGRWTLLDLFVVMVVAMATLRIFGLGAGALALVTLVLVYTEPAAPRWVWLFVLASEALRRAVREGRLARGVQALRLASLGALILIAVPFAVAQVRMGLFPALERPWQMVVAQAGADRELAESEMRRAQVVAGEMLMEQDASVPSMAAPAPRSPKRFDFGSGYANVYAPDPDARVQTGPGRPDWSWQRVTLGWSGPVARDQQLGLWLLPPWLSGTLAILRVALLAALVLLLLGRLAFRPRSNTPAILGSTIALALAVGLGIGLAPAPARADLPTPDLLNELRERLLEAPSCAPSCATASRLALEIAPDRLELRLGVDVAAESAVPLPSGGTGEAAGFTPDTISVNGRPTEAVRRDAAGRLWLRLAPGSHVIGIAGPLPARANVEIPLPLRPQRVEVIGTPRGWTLIGLDAAGRVPGALQLAREAAPAAGAGQPDAQPLEPSAIPPFVSVRRTLGLGLRWQVTTEVLRVAPPEGAIVLEVPLLAGESVTTAGVRVQGGRALVTLAPGESRTGWISGLAISPSLALEAPRDVAWTETWRLDPSPLWHVTADGIPAIDAPAAGTRLREWRPWPGETLALGIERPEGAGGETLTIDRSQLTLSPGPRATDATLALSLRSSQGGQHFVTLPEGAELTELTLDGAVQPLRQEGLRVPIPLAPGAHSATLRWREPVGIRTFLRGSAVDLGAPSVNAHVELMLPSGRWVLFAGGPRLGPSVLFWPVLLVVAALAVALGRISWTPLRTGHWLGLGLGLTQAPLPAAAVVVVWLLALGWRGRLSEPERTRSALAFDLLQVLLVAFTLLALASLFYAIQVGLLGSPEMKIAGNGSDSAVLRWYQDRAGPVLPQPWLLSLSLWFYRGVMLVWALWVAQALVGWLRWGFAQWSHGGYWLRRPPRHREQAPRSTPS